jgi:hypothetical protein
MYHDKQHNHYAFDSITQMAAWTQDNRLSHSVINESSGKFYNFQSWSQVAARCAVGHDESVGPASKLMQQLETGLSIETTAYQSSVAGCFPNVPEFLAGEPECMWDQVHIDSDTAPLAIYLDLTSSAGITPDEFRKRGIAVLALTMLLSSIRPISLHVCTVMGARVSDRPDTMRKRHESYSIASARIETAPLDLARAAYVMTDVAAARRMFYAVGNTDGSWPTFTGVGYGSTTSAEYVKRVRDILSLDSEVLYIPAVSYMSGEVEQMVNQPVEWLNAKLAMYGGVTAEA